MLIGIHLSPTELEDCCVRFDACADKKKLLELSEKKLSFFSRLDPAVNDHLVLEPYAAGHNGALLALLQIIHPENGTAEALLNFLRWIPNQSALMWQSGLSLGQFLKGAVLALDAVGESLAVSERREFLRGLILKCIDNPDPNALANNYPTGVIPYKPYLEMPGVGFHCHDHEVNNWDVICGQGLLYVARAAEVVLPELKDDIDEWVNIAMVRLRRFLELSYSVEGEYREGPGYYSYGNLAALTMLDILRNWPGREDLFSSLDAGGLLNTPRWLRALYPQRIEDGTFIFNDTQRSHAESPAVFYWIAARSRDPLAQFMGDRLSLLGQERYLDAAVFAWLWRDDSVPANDISGPLTEDFGCYGSVVCRTGFGENDNSLLFRCGTHAGAHTHADRGNILFSAYGRDFLVDAGMFSDRTKDIYENYHTQAEAHNCVFPGGIGQFRPTNENAPAGKVTVFRQVGDATVIEGEYAATYPEDAGVLRCVRRINWYDAGWFRVDDEFEGDPEYLRLLWHFDNRDRLTVIDEVEIMNGRPGVVVCRGDARMLVQPLLPGMSCVDLGVNYQEDDPEGARVLAFDVAAKKSSMLFLPYTGPDLPEKIFSRIRDFL